jgi:hypothetical protein
VSLFVLATWKLVSSILDTVSNVHDAQAE